MKTEKPKLKLIGTKIYKGKKRCRACEKARKKRIELTNQLNKH